MKTVCTNCERDLGNLTILETLEVMEQHGPGKCLKAGE